MPLLGSARVARSSDGGPWAQTRRASPMYTAIVDYIHANPVRRGLVEQSTDWQWSSARFWEGRSDVPLRMDDPLG